VKLTLNVLEKRSDDAEKSWPGHMFGGRIRTSTLLLIVVFLAVWWVYDTYRPEAAPKPPAPQVVPPGFVPDPNYTWVPRSRVQEPTATFTPTPITTVPPAPTTTTTTAPPPFQLPQLPCLLPAPLCPPTSTPTPSPPLPSQPRPGP
jgi:hypothetical protein